MRLASTEELLKRLVEKDQELKKANVHLRLINNERAFRKGYAAGYHNGDDDASSYDRGRGFKHQKTRNRDEDDAWEEYKTTRPIV